MPAPSVQVSPRKAQQHGHNLADTLRRWFSSMTASLLLHGSVLLICSTIAVIAATTSEKQVWVLRFRPLDVEPLEELTITLDQNQRRPEPDVAIGGDPNPTAADVSIAAPWSVVKDGGAVAEQTPVGFDLPPVAELLVDAGGRPDGGGLQGRHGDRRARLLQKHGGTPESETAVRKGLNWLAAHQSDDGGWRFDHRDSICEGRCGNWGTNGSTTGATGLVLLAFLGAGHTHEEGDFQETVDKGLYYLTGRMIETHQGGDLQEGTMYAQGIATIALCEAYAMTGDKALRHPAQRAVDFIVGAQHEGGGWRYFPGQPGDTTVFGWQLMALKSANLAGLDAPSPTFALADRFLDTVQTDDGAAYGYLKPGEAPGPTAVALLSRMYLGWRRHDDRLKRGVSRLARWGPHKEDMYFNYYATQIMFHYGGPEWERWNETLREKLIAAQNTRGHEHGSWHFADKHGVVGGRLYNTAMCVMMLEVYYRHMPLYSSKAVTP